MPSHPLHQKCFPQTRVVWHSSDSRKGTILGGHGRPVRQYPVGCVKRNATHYCSEKISAKRQMSADGAAGLRRRVAASTRTRHGGEATMVRCASLHAPCGNRRIINRPAVFRGSSIPWVECFHARLAGSIDVRASFLNSGITVGGGQSALKIRRFPPDGGKTAGSSLMDFGGA